MKVSTAAGTAFLAVSVNGQLDIAGILKNATVNPNDPRFTQWKAPGAGDGKPQFRY